MEIKFSIFLSWPKLNKILMYRILELVLNNAIFPYFRSNGRLL